MKIKIVALKRDEDFKELLTGRKLSNKYFIMFYKKLLKKESNYINLSIVAKKKIFPKAVDRNFCKRRVKNAVNEAIKNIPLKLNYSYLILAKENVLKKNYFEDLKKTTFEEFNKIR
jgi:ribonuclease P protein component